MNETTSKVICTVAIVGIALACIGIIIVVAGASSAGEYCFLTGGLVLLGALGVFGADAVIAIWKD